MSLSIFFQVLFNIKYFKWKEKKKKKKLIESPMSDINSSNKYANITQDTFWRKHQKAINKTKQQTDT
jgi:hypothetical protein